MGAGSVRESQSLIAISDEKSSHLELGWETGSVSSVGARGAKIAKRVISLVRPVSATRLCRRFAYAFIPQLLRTVIWNDTTATTKQFSTSYLNGLRGITALKVFTFHYTFAFSDFGFTPWGYDDRHRYFLELPIVRYFYSGFTSHVFFGIAGYLCSLRLLQLMESTEAVSQAQVLLIVSASLFRRAFRLYMPVFLITFITATGIYMGVYERNRLYLLNHDKLFPGIWNEPKPQQYPTYGQQLRFWSFEMYALTNIACTNTVYPDHDQHLWSILSEMRASLHLYGCLLALARCRKQIRLLFLLVLTGLYFCWNQWETWVYILGAAVAQLDVLLTDRQQQKLSDLISNKEDSLTSPIEESALSLSRYISRIGKVLRKRANIRHLDFYSGRIFRVVAFLVAFYLLSYPITGSDHYAPGYMTLNRLIPKWMERKDKFYPNIGTALLILLLARSSPSSSRWRRMLTSEFPQYLGKISFGLYLVHGPIFHMVGYMLPHWVWWSMGIEGVNASDFEWTAVVVFGWAVSLAMSLYAADVWTREVEGRCVKLVKALENVCFR